MATVLQEYREQYSRLMALHLVFFVLSVLNGRSSAKAAVNVNRFNGCYAADC